MRTRYTYKLILTLAFVSGCAAPYPPIDPNVVERAQPKVEVAQAPLPAFTSHQKLAAEKHGGHGAPPHHAPSAAGASHHVVGMPPMQALSLLVEGNTRFVEGQSKHGAQGLKYRTSLAGGQKPHAIVLSCSDSRVPPELVFDRGLGEIFVVRTAGQVPDGAGLASMEYAIEHLGARLIVVMGHSACGAVKAALTTPVGTTAGSPNLDQLVGEIRPNIKDFKGDAVTSDPTIVAPVRAQVDGVAKSLTKNSKIINDAVASGKVKIVHGLYHLGSGKVDVWF